MAASLALQQTDHAPLRLMRLVAVAIGVAVAAIALLWIVPSLLDWSRYRGAIARFASGELGRPVQIDGAISLVLLPAPLVVANGVRLGDRGDGLTLVAPALRLRVAIMPLLTGRVVPRELVLSNPAISLPWPLPPASLTGDRPDWLGAASARIEHGTMRVGSIRLADVNADLVAGGLGGAAPDDLTVSGSAHGLGLLWRFTNRLGAPDLAGDAPVELSLQAQPQAGGAAAPDAGGHFIGTLTHDGGLTGRLTAQAADLSRLMPAPPVAAHADGTVTLGRGPARAELALDIGGVGVAARLRPGAGTQVLSLSTGRLDLDAWDAALGRLHAAPGRSQMIVLPFPVSLDLSVDAVQLRGELVRGVHAAMDVDGARGVLQAASATLPGDASLTLAGTLQEDDRGLGLVGVATLDAPRLRTTLDWLGTCGLALGGGLPDAVLRDAHLSGRVVAGREMVEVAGLSGTLEQSRVSDGRIDVMPATGSIRADLTLDRLAADNWLPAGAWPQWPAISRRLHGTDIALTLQVGTLTARGRTLDHVVLDAATAAGGLAVAGLTANIDGLHTVLSGTIGGDGTVTDGRFDLTAAQATPLGRDLADLGVPGVAQVADYLWSGPVALHVDAVGTQAALVTSLSLDLADARLEAHPLLDLQTGAWSAQMTLRHPGAPRLLGAPGLPRARDWVGEGSLSLLAQLSGAAGHVHADSFDLTAGELHASGDLDYLAAAGKAPSVTGHVATDTLPLPAFEPHARMPMDLAWLRRWGAQLDLGAAEVTIADGVLLTDAKAQVGLRDGVLSVDIGSALLGGGVLAGGVRLDATATPPRLTVNGSVNKAVLADGLFGTPLDLGSGSFATTLALTAQGYSPAALTASLAGSALVDGTGGTVTGLDLPAAHRAPAGPALDAALRTGTTRFDRMTVQARIADGLATVDHGSLDGPDGAATVAGTVDLTAGTLNLLAALPDQLSVRLTGPWGSPQRKAEVVGQGGQGALPPGPP